MSDFQRTDYIKAAKELNNLAGAKLKVVAIKTDVLKKAIQETVPTLVDFDFSELSQSALDILDDLNCDMPDELEEIKGGLIEENEEETTKELSPKLNDPDDHIENIELEDDSPDGEEMDIEEDDGVNDTIAETNVIPMDKEFTTDESLVAAAEDLIDVLGYDKDEIKKFKALDFKAKVKELQKMADVINEPYAGDDGKMVTPEDKPSDFKPETITVFEANEIKVKWHEEKKIEERLKVKAKQDKATEKGKGTTKKDSIKKDEALAVKTKDKPKTKPIVKAEKKEKTINRSVSIAQALEKGGTKKEIIENSNRIFIENNGKDNIKMAEKRLGYMLPALIYLNVVEEKDNKFSLIK